MGIDIHFTLQFTLIWNMVGYEHVILVHTHMNMHSAMHVYMRMDVDKQ